MATFLAPVESQPAFHLGERAAREKDHRFAALLITALTPFALAVHGYHPYAEDGGLYITGVKRLLDSTLYPQGTAFVLAPTRFSLFAPMVASTVRLSHLGLPAVLLTLHLASIWVTLAAAWMLAERCWPTRTARAGAVVLLACWLALPIAGTSLLLMDPYLTARSLSTPCTLLALVGVLDMTERRRNLGEPARHRLGLCLCAASLLLAFAMHPLMAAYALGATLMLLCARSPALLVRRWGPAALSAAAIVLATSFQLAGRPESVAYRRVVLTRTYWFPAAWHWYELLGLIAPLTILAIIAWQTPHQTPRQDSSPRKSLARMAVAAGTTACLIALLFARVGASTHLVARMQPLRTFQVVYLVMILVLGAALGEYVLERSAWRWAATLLMMGSIMLGAARSAFPNSSHVSLPWIAPRNPWAQAFLWIRQHTPKDALFALDADYINAPGEDAQCFRAIAERSALPDYSKDGGEASIAPDLTDAWTRGQQAQKNLSAPSTTDAERISALNPLGVSWIVLQASAVTSFDCPYANSAAKVCRLR